MMSSTEGPIDVHSMLLDYQDGLLGGSEIIRLFTYLIQSELVWSLRPEFGRTAMALINLNLIPNVIVLQISRMFAED